MAGPMLPVTHDLKVWPEYFAPLDHGTKNFEFRTDDRTPRYEAGDFLRLRECAAADGYTGRVCWRRISYVARGGVIPDGYCCMALQPASPFEIASLEAVGQADGGSDG